MAIIASLASVFSQVTRGLAFLVLFCAGLGLPFVLTDSGTAGGGHVRPAQRSHGCHGRGTKAVRRLPPGAG